MKKIIVIGFCFLLIGCNSTTNTIDVTEYFILTTSPNESLVPKITSTQIISSLTPSARSTITLPPTKIPSSEAYNLFLYYLASINDCVLPCMWGIVPGETTIETLENEIFPFGRVTMRDDRYGATQYEINILTQSEEEEDVKIYFFVDDGIVVEIFTVIPFLFPGNEINWQKIVGDLGVPDNIWVYGIFPSPSDTINYRLGLQYQSKGGFLEFIGETTKLENSGNLGIQLCPTSEEFSNRVLIASWDDGYTNLPRYDLPTLEREYMQFSEFDTEITAESFYWNYIIENQDTCFSLFRSLEN